MLLDGTIEFDGEQQEGQSAYEQRCAAESASDDFSELILEPAQLDRAIRRGIQRDTEVRHAMLLRMHMGMDEYEIEEFLGSKRPGFQLLERGIELARRHERGSYSQLKRVRAHDGKSDTPVCWRCMRAEVKQPGMECEVCPPPEVPSRLRGLRRGTDYPGHSRAPLYRKPASELSDAERLREIEALTATQDSGDYHQSNDREYRERVVPIGGSIRNAEDVRAADRRWQAENGNPSADGRVG